MSQHAEVKAAMQVSHGQRVRHQTWTDDNQAPLVGTVHLFLDPEPGTPEGEVRWDGYFIADQLDLVIDHLAPA